MPRQPATGAPALEFVIHGEQEAWDKAPSGALPCHLGSKAQPIQFFLHLCGSSKSLSVLRPELLEPLRSRLADLKASVAIIGSLNSSSEVATCLPLA